MTVTTVLLVLAGMFGAGIALSWASLVTRRRGDQARVDATRAARWEARTVVAGAGLSGKVRVEVVRVARLRGETWTTETGSAVEVDVNDSAALLDAQADAEMKVATYNAFVPDGRTVGDTAC